MCSGASMVGPGMGYVGVWGGANSNVDFRHVSAGSLKFHRLHEAEASHTRKRQSHFSSRSRYCATKLHGQREPRVAHSSHLEETEQSIAVLVLTDTVTGRCTGIGSAETSTPDTPFDVTFAMQNVRVTPRTNSMLILTSHASRNNFKTTNNSVVRRKRIVLPALHEDSFELKPFNNSMGAECMATEKMKQGRIRQGEDSGVVTSPTDTNRCRAL